MEFLQDLLAAIGVVLNGIPQGLLAMSLGFASVPTALGFLVGAAGCAALGSVAPISFQAETVVMAGTMGKNMRERLSMVLFAGITMAVLGACGLLTVITNFAGDVVLHAMMAGVGLVLTKLSLGMLKENALVGGVSIAVAFLVYFFLGTIWCTPSFSAWWRPALRQSWQSRTLAAAWATAKRWPGWSCKSPSSISPCCAARWRWPA